MKAGFIAVVGRPNVGKSTLINKLVSEKVAIVSDKAGTTRDNIKGILNFKDNQYIFIDTPGIHKPQHLLGEYMTNIAVKILKDVDIITFLSSSTVEAFYESLDGDFFILGDKKIASIGPMTSETIRRLGMKVDYEAEKYTANGVLDIIFK